jgi:hypothetical protein
MLWLWAAAVLAAAPNALGPSLSSGPRVALPGNAPTNDVTRAADGASGAVFAGGAIDPDGETGE